ncbi:MAG: left-handed beta-roll domain-containing protein [Saprospiraceae bacterium]|nr:left-handed beta-roll domain-containing protein [Saprospiraceae bacterium]
MEIIGCIDLSISNFPSSVSGATGKNSIAMGYDTEASASYSTAMGYGTVEWYKLYCNRKIYISKWAILYCNGI